MIKVFKNVIRENWFYFVLFLFIVLSSSFMNVINFNIPRDSGFWSIHTTDHFDGWHLLKLIKHVLIIIGFIRWNQVKDSRYLTYLIAIYAAINLIPHEIILHGL